MARPRRRQGHGGPYGERGPDGEGRDERHRERQASEERVVRRPPAAPGGTLFRGATLITFDPPRVEHADLLVRDGRIVEKGRRLDPPRHAEIVDVRGYVVMPGLVDVQARLGLDPFPGLTATLPAAERTARTSAAHDETSVIWGAFQGALEALRSGTTCIFDLHTSPGFVGGALERLKDVFLTVGLRSVVAYRIAEAEEAQGIEEALEAARSAAAYGGGDQVRLGVGAARGATDATLAELGTIATRYGAPVMLDLEGDAGAAGRASRAGLLGEATVVSGTNGLSAADSALLAAAGVTVAWSPSRGESRPATDAATALASLASGRGIFGQLHAAADRLRAGLDASAPDSLLATLRSGHALATRIFGLPFGTFEPGAAADLVVMDRRPAIPLNDATVAQHLTYGLDEGAIVSVMVEGRFLIRDGVPMGVDVRSLSRVTQRGALDLWRRLTGEDFPGWVRGAEEDAVEEQTARAAATAEAIPAEPDDLDADAVTEDAAETAAEDPEAPEGDAPAAGPKPRARRPRKRPARDAGTPDPVGEPEGEPADGPKGDAESPPRKARQAPAREAKAPATRDVAPVEDADGDDTPEADGAVDVEDPGRKEPQEDEPFGLGVF